MMVETPKDCIKRRLNSYTNIVREMQQLEQHMADLEDRILPGGKKFDGMPRQPGAGGDLSDIVAERLELVERYRAKIDELHQAQLTIERMIEGLDPLERRLMRAKYIEGHTWEEVCVIMSYCWRQVHRIHSRVLVKLAESEDIQEEKI